MKSRIEWTTKWSIFVRDIVAGTIVGLTFLTIPTYADDLAFGRFKPNYSNLPKSITQVKSADIPNSGSGYRFELYGGDCVSPNYKGQSEGDCTFNSVRSQLQENGAAQSTKQPEAAWYAWDFFMPRDFPIHPGQVNGHYNYAQWKGVNCPHAFIGSDHFSSQLFLLVMKTTGVNDCEPIKKISLVPMSSLKGRWTRFEIRARWSFEADGEIAVFVDGQDAGSYSGPTLMASNEQGGRLTKMNHFDFGPYLCCTTGISGIKPGYLFYANVARAKTREALTE